ncbi:MAG: hypothetical protein JRC93_12375 [Deltaproteobacteria bacterium]|nr:hypothetical protein [Deltaproteobacteria bacterium]
MLKEFVDRIVSLAAPNMKKVGDWEYSDKPLNIVQFPSPDPIEMNSLSGLVEYLKKGKVFDLGGAENLIVHIKGPIRVSLYSGLNINLNRHEYVRVSHNMPQFPFNRHLTVEEFIIGLQAKFRPTTDLAEVLKVVGNVKDEHVTTMKDDGVSQRVTVNAGAANVENKIVPNPITLAPYRTFPDVDQPESQFVLRVRSEVGNIGCALFEADGDQWKMEAMRNIKGWLEYETKGMENPPVILA